MNIPNLLRQIADHIESSPPEKVKEFWPDQSGDDPAYYPSAIPGQKIPKITGNPSVDFTTAMMGGVGKPTPERDANLAEVDRQTNATVYSGLFPALNFLHGPREGAEAAFIYAANRLHGAKSSDTEFIYRRAGLFSGTHWDIARLIGYGEQEAIYLHKSDEAIMADFPDTPLKRAVLAVK